MTFPTIIAGHPFADAPALASWLTRVANTAPPPGAMYPSEALFPLLDVHAAALNEATALLVRQTHDPEAFRLAVHLGVGAAFYDALLGRFEDGSVPTGTGSAGVPVLQEATSALVTHALASDAPLAARATALLLGQGRWDTLFALLGRADPNRFLVGMLEACAGSGALSPAHVGITGAALAADHPEDLPTAARVIARYPQFHARFREAIADARPELDPGVRAEVDRALTS